MARTTQAPAPATAPEPKAPDFIAWHVSNRGDKAFWTKGIHPAEAALPG